jgi:DNA-binding NarL/FixJ family response regulator
MNNKYFAFNERIEKFISMDFPFPVRVYAKDLKFHYLAANNFLLQYHNIPHESDIVGISIKKLFAASSEIYNNIEQNDRSALDMNEIFFLEHVKANHSMTDDLILSIKTPLKNSCNHTIGVFGVSFYLNKTPLEKILTILNNLRFFSPTALINPTIMVPKKNDASNQLSKRENECVQCLSYGMSSKIIARKLGISYRTVECHIQNAKLKLNCSYKYQLIKKVFMDF